MRALLLLLFFAVLPACAARGRPGTIPIRFGEHTLTVEVAAKDPERQQGLMFRREMGASEGMLFVFDEPHEASFWMKNTPLPLSIAFLDANHVVLNVEQMAPYDENNFHKSKGFALYAVEAHRGWFEERGIGAGSKAEFELEAK